MYSSTLFDFSDDIWAISNFRKRVPASNFNHVTKVSVFFLGSWKAPSSPSGKGHKSDETKQWPIIWETLAAMENLQWLRFEVRLNLHVSQGCYWESHKDDVLGPVKLVSQPSYFELILPFDVGRRAQELSCHVIRHDVRDAWIQ
jgi:hypothetical protein